MPRARRQGPRQNYRANVPAELVAFFLGEPKPEEVDAMTWAIITRAWASEPGDRLNLAAGWRAVGPEILERWIKERPGTRPRGFWIGAPEPRQKIEDPSAAPHIARGAESWRTAFGFWGGGGPTLFEGVGAYLDRVNEWAPGERDRAPKSAWEPIVYEYSKMGWDE